MTRDRLESWLRLGKEYGFQSLFAVMMLCAFPWCGYYVVLPVAEDHRRFLSRMADVTEDIAKTQQQQSAAISSIERFVAAHCMEQRNDRRNMGFAGENR